MALAMIVFRFCNCQLFFGRFTFIYCAQAHEQTLIIVPTVNDGKSPARGQRCCRAGRVDLLVVTALRCGMVATKLRAKHPEIQCSRTKKMGLGGPKLPLQMRWNIIVLRDGL